METPRIPRRLSSHDERTVPLLPLRLARLRVTLPCRPVATPPSGHVPRRLAPGQGPGDPPVHLPRPPVGLDDVVQLARRHAPGVGPDDDDGRPGPVAERLHGGAQGDGPVGVGRPHAGDGQGGKRGRSDGVAGQLLGRRGGRRRGRRRGRPGGGVGAAAAAEEVGRDGRLPEARGARVPVAREAVQAGEVVGVGARGGAVLEGYLVGALGLEGGAGVALLNCFAFNVLAT